MVRHLFAIDNSDNIKWRKLFAQLTFVNKLAVTVIILVAASFILLSFDAALKLGTGLSASAGVAGIVIVLAAKVYREPAGGYAADIYPAFTPKWCTCWRVTCRKHVQSL